MSLGMPYHMSYHRLLEYLLIGGKEELNERTGSRIKAMRGGFSFDVDLADGTLPVTGSRKLFPRTVAAEVAWFLLGTQNAFFIQKQAPIWDKFVEDLRISSAELDVRYRDVPGALVHFDDYDAETDEWKFKGVAAAYGHRWRHAFGRDQIGLAIEALLVNPSDRRVVVSAWDPREDGLGAPGQRNVPCPAMFTLSIIDNELHSTLLIRSSDVFVGLPYDVMGHALLMHALCASINRGGGSPLTPGALHVSLAHPHLYESHWGAARECLGIYGTSEERLTGPSLDFHPSWSVDDIVILPHGYITRVWTAAVEVEWPNYNPKPEVIV